MKFPSASTTWPSSCRKPPSTGWRSCPVWYDPAEPRRGDDLVVLTEKLAAADIEETVGVIDHPPAGAEFARRLSPDAAIADVFAVDSSAWLPLLDPVLTRL